MFFVSVASKGLSSAVSLLFATLAGRSISVAAKGLTMTKCWQESNWVGAEDFEGVRRTAWQARMVRGAQRDRADSTTPLYQYRYNMSMITYVIERKGVRGSGEGN